MTKRALMIHQGAELYGSDKIFLNVVGSLMNDFEIEVVLDSSGPLVEELTKLGIKNVRVMKLGVLRKSEIKRPVKLLKLVYRFFAAVKSLFSMQKKNKYDLIYVNTLALISPLFLRLFFKNLVIVHHIHEIQSSPKLVTSALYNISSLLASKVIVVSGAVKQHILQVLLGVVTSKKLVVVRNGIQSDVAISDESIAKLEKELSRSMLRKKTNPYYIAMVGRLHSWKGQMELLDSVDIARKENENIVVVFYGEVYPGYESLKEKFKQKIQDLDLEENVLFMGQREDADVLFCLTKFSLLPSTLPDPFPTVVLEAMRQGAAVIAFDHGGVTEMIENNESGFLVAVNDFNALGRKIIDVSGDMGLRDTVGRNAKSVFLNNYSIDRFREVIRQEVCGI